jgi:hypothetical protein
MEGVSIVPTNVLQDLITEVKETRAYITKIKEELEIASSKYMTTAQVCKYINKSENWVLLHKHDLGSSKRSGTLLFKRADIDEFINSDYFKK